MHFLVNLYWYAGELPTPTKLPKVLGILDPSAFRVAVNVAVLFPESTRSDPVAVAGNWVRIEEGTVNVFAPAVVIQMNSVEVVTWLAPVPVLVEEAPTISSISDALPPVQLIVRGELRTTVVGKPPVTVIAVASVSEVLNEPTSLPPAPANV